MDITILEYFGSLEAANARGRQLIAHSESWQHVTVRERSHNTPSTRWELLYEGSPKG